MWGTFGRIARVFITSAIIPGRWCFDARLAISQLASSHRAVIGACADTVKRAVINYLPFRHERRVFVTLGRGIKILLSSPKGLITTGAGRDIRYISCLVNAAGDGLLAEQETPESFLIFIKHPLGR